MILEEFMLNKIFRYDFDAEHFFANLNERFPNPMTIPMCPSEKNIQPVKTCNLFWGAIFSSLDPDPKNTAN